MFVKEQRKDEKFLKGAYVCSIPNNTNQFPEINRWEEWG